MHLHTHTKPSSIGQSGRWQSPYHDTMIDRDKNVGTVLKALDDLGIANNTFVMYSTDNGPHMNTWPDGAMTPFRNEKNSNWEGAYRVPAMFRWPGKIRPGEVSNEIVSTTIVSGRPRPAGGRNDDQVAAASAPHLVPSKTVQGRTRYLRNGIDPQDAVRKIAGWTGGHGCRTTLRLLL